MFPPSYRTPGATLTAEPGCPAAPPSGGGRFLMALELMRTEFKVALTPSRGRLQKAIAASKTQNRTAATAHTTVISEDHKPEKVRKKRGHFAPQQSSECGTSGGGVSAAGLWARCSHPPPQAGCLYTRAPAFPAPRGRQQSRDGISKLWEELGAGVFVCRKQGGL